MQNVSEPDLAMQSCTLQGGSQVQCNQYLRKLLDSAQLSLAVEQAVSAACSREQENRGYVVVILLGLLAQPTKNSQQRISKHTKPRASHSTLDINCRAIFFKIIKLTNTQKLTGEHIMHQNTYNSHVITTTNHIYIYIYIYIYNITNHL